jgi:dolichyl-phosphate beta-glucosyltransferase
VISVVIPAYNEAERIAPTIKELIDHLKALDIDAEILVVDDGSADDTIGVASRALSGFASGKVIPTSPNRGKGHAVRIGMLAASRPLRLFMDADGSTSLDALKPCLEAVQADPSGRTVAIASVAIDGAVITHPQPFPRGIAGRIANLLIQALVLPGIKDTQRGFKLFSAEATEAAFSDAIVNGWLFDVETLAIARRRGYTVVEIPVVWEHREDSRVTGGSYFSTLAELLAIRWRLWFGGLH